MTTRWVLGTGGGSPQGPRERVGMGLLEEGLAERGRGSGSWCVCARAHVCDKVLGSQEWGRLRDPI